MFRVLGVYNFGFTLKLTRNFFKLIQNEKAFFSNVFSDRNLRNWSWWAVSCHTHVHSFNSSISLTSRKQKWLEEDIGQSAIWWYFLCLHIKVIRVGIKTICYPFYLSKSLCNIKYCSSLKLNYCKKFFFLIHLLVRDVLVMEKLEIQKTKPSFIISVLKVEY